MIVVLNVYRIKFEKAEQAQALWREGMVISSLTAGDDVELRLLTDSLGTYFTLMIEVTAESLGTYEKWTREVLGNHDYGDWYHKFLNLTVGQYREIYHVVDHTAPVHQINTRWAHVAD